MPCSAQASRPPRNEFEEILRRPKLKRQWDARKLCSPALTVATAKVLEETAATAGEPALRVVAVVASEAGVPKVHLHLSRGKRSTVATGFSFPSPGLRRNVIVAINPVTDITSAQQQSR